MRVKSVVAAPQQKQRMGVRIGELQKEARRVAGLLKSIASPVRLVILCQLIEGERSVRALEHAVGLSQSGISQHLAVLRRSDVVVTRREGQTVFYSIASGEIVSLMGALHSLFCSSAQNPLPTRLRSPRRIAAQV